MYPQSMFLSKNKKNIELYLLKIFNFYNLRKICILHGHVFVMGHGLPPEIPHTRIHDCYMLFFIDSRLFFSKSS